MESLNWICIVCNKNLRSKDGYIQHIYKPKTKC